ncbi:MAG TPA: hypothetical protein VMU68_11070 [Acidimicrobiales bacterium]|nr:hypothetical protein [Acidimicrobiales bacterium]
MKLEAGELSNRLRERGVVVIAMSLGDQFVLQGCGRHRHGLDRSDIFRQLETDGQVLSMQGDLEAERVLIDVTHATGMLALIIH